MDKNKTNKLKESSGLPRGIKITLAILGGTNVIFSVFLPMAIGLLISTYYPLNNISRGIIVIAGIMSSMYRAFDIGGIETLEYFFEKFKKD